MLELGNLRSSSRATWRRACACVGVWFFFVLRGNARFFSNVYIPASAVAKKSPRGENDASVIGSRPFLNVAASSREAGSSSFTAPDVKPTSKQLPAGSYAKVRGRSLVASNCRTVSSTYRGTQQKD